MAAAWVVVWVAWAAWTCNKRASASRSQSLRTRSGVQFREKAPFTRGFFLRSARARAIVIGIYSIRGGGNRQIAVDGIIGAGSRSSRSLSNSSQTPPGSQFFYLDRPSRSKPRIYSFGGNWLCSKSAVFSHGGYEDTYPCKRRPSYPGRQPARPQANTLARR
jgi:hypothetical protein